MRAGRCQRAENFLPRALRKWKAPDNEQLVKQEYRLEFGRARMRPNARRR